MKEAIREQGKLKYWFLHFSGNLTYPGEQTVWCQVKGVCALRGKFGPLKSQKLKIAFHQFLLFGLLEE